MTSVSTKTRCPRRPLFPSWRPNSGHRALRICATSRLTHLSKLQNYSINSSAWASNVGGSETERLGGLEVDRQFELYWGLVVAPGDGDNCMLIKGDLATADLPRSWFYSRADLDDQSDYETPER